MPPCTTPNGWWCRSSRVIVARTRLPLISWSLKSADRRNVSIISPDGIGGVVWVASVTCPGLCGSAFGRRERPHGDGDLDDRAEPVLLVGEVGVPDPTVLVAAAAGADGLERPAEHRAKEAREVAHARARVAVLPDAVDGADRGEGLGDG